MKPTLWAAKLYPRWWRERYGEEFTALLEDARPGFGGTLDILRGAVAMQLSSISGNKILVFGAALGLLIGFITASFITPEYASHAIISVQMQEGSIAVDSIRPLSERVFSRAALTEMIDRQGLYLDDRPKSIDELLEKLKRNIRVSAAPAVTGSPQNQVMEVTFTYPDRIIAQNVVNELVHRFIDENIRFGMPTRIGTTLRVIDAADLPKEPVFPDHESMAIEGLVIGVVLSGLGAAILHFRRRRSPNLANIGPTPE